MWCGFYPASTVSDEASSRLNDNNCHSPVSPVLCSVKCNESESTNGNKDSESERQEEEVSKEVVVVMNGPRTPTVKEYVEHCLTHVPFQAWCRVCVLTKAKNQPHKKHNSKRECTVFSMDYMFMGNKDREEIGKYPVLVIKERKSGGVWALATEKKGPSDKNIIKRIVKVISEVGDKDPLVIIKSDQEPAMIAIQKEVRK